MTIANLALIAMFVMLAVATFDGLRGKTALGKFRLSKHDEEPTRFWFAIVLYVNMVFGMFWLSGQAQDANTAGASADEVQTITIPRPST